MILDNWELVTYSLMALLGLAGMVTNSLLRSPEWLRGDEVLARNWSKIAWGSFASGVFLGGLAFALNNLNHWGQQSIVPASLGGYILFQSIFTDFRLRRVDRWGQRIANLLTIGAGAIVLANYGYESDWIIYGGFLVGMFALGFFPGIGDSDGRAFVFLVAATYPIAALPGLRWCAILYLVLTVIYYIVHVLRKRVNPLKSAISLKINYALVPVIMTATMIPILIGRLLP